MLQTGSAGRTCCLLSLLPHAWSQLWRMPAQLGQHRSTGHLSVLPPCSCSPSPVSQWLPASVHSRQQPEKRPAQGVSPGWLIAPEEPRRPLCRALALAASLPASGITPSAHPDPQLQTPLPTTGSTWRRLPAQATATGKELGIHCPERGTATAGRWPQAKDFTRI